jgi:hypothetical protein
MSIKVIFQILAFSLVFTLFTSYHALGEGDRYNEELVNIKCRETMQIDSLCVIQATNIVMLCKYLTWFAFVASFQWQT